MMNSPLVSETLILVNMPLSEVGVDAHQLEEALSFFSKSILNAGSRREVRDKVCSETNVIQAMDMLVRFALPETLLSKLCELNLEISRESGLDPQLVRPF